MKGTPPTRAEYRAECIRWMTEFEPSLFVTFVFNTQITPDAARRKLETFHKMLDGKLVGRAALRLPDERSVYIAIIEKPDANLHIHALFKLTDDLQRLRFCLVAHEIWAKLVEAGNLDIQRVTCAEGVASYVTKELTPETSERLLMPPHLEKRLSTIR